MMNKPTVLITGAGARLGRSFALHLAKQGYNIALHYNNNRQGVDQVAEEIGNKVQVSCHHNDFQKIEHISGLIEEVQKEQGRIDLLINNASIFPDNEFHSLNAQVMMDCYAINCVAPVLLSQDFAQVHGANAGHIVNIIDTRIAHKHPQRFAYSMSKKSLHQATLDCAQLLSPNIRVNAICPGPVLPPVDGATASFQQAIQSTPLQQQTSVDNLLMALDYLNANLSVTGEVLFVDSGQHLN